MELKQKDVITEQKHEFCTISEFIDKYHPGLTLQAVNYAMKNESIDFMKLGKDRYVVLTENTLSYTPQPRTARDARVIKSTMKL